MTGRGWSFQSRLLVWLLAVQVLLWLVAVPLWFSGVATAVRQADRPELTQAVADVWSAAHSLETARPEVIDRPEWETLRSGLAKIRQDTLGGSAIRSDFFVRLARDFLLLAAGQLVLAVGLALLLARSLSRQLRVLTQVIRQASQGDRTARIPALKGREFNLLGQEFNRLMINLQSSEKKLMEQANLLGWQETARFLSHQIKNPLTSIRLAARNLQDLGALVHPLAQDNSAVLQEETLRLVNLVARLNELTGFGPLDLQTVSLRELTASLAAKTYAVPLEVVWMGPDLALLGDRVLLEQVFLNFFRNSAEAAGGQTPGPAEHGGQTPELLAPQGQTSVSTEPAPLQLRFVSQGQTLHLTDGLSGLTPALVAKLFKPPFTTKAGGSGLGLYFCRKILHMHGVSLTADLSATGGLALHLDFQEGPLG